MLHVAAFHSGLFLSAARLQCLFVFNGRGIYAWNVTVDKKRLLRLKLPNALSHLPDYLMGLLLFVPLVTVPVAVTFSGRLGHLPLLPGITALSRAQRATRSHKLGDFCCWFEWECPCKSNGLEAAGL